MADTYLIGQLLIAMPAMQDPRFARSVIYLCNHNADGAIGLIINRIIENLSVQDLLRHLGLDQRTPNPGISPHLHYGGPVEEQRGFVLHSDDYMRSDSLTAGDRIALTASMDIVRDIADGRGPSQHILAIGYAGWGPEQLDQEIQDNAWLNVDPDHPLIFDDDFDGKWDRCMAKIGVDASLLSTVAGRA